MKDEIWRLARVMYFMFCGLFAFACLVNVVLSFAGFMQSEMEFLYRIWMAMEIKFEEK